MGYQTWAQLGFFHWRVDAGSLAALIPTGLEVDTCDGDAWIGIVPFAVRGSSPRGIPALPYFSHFEEVNLRTYVHQHGEEPGVFFFSLDANNLAAVIGARVTYHLPYFHARIALESHGGRNQVRSSRRQDRAAVFSGNYEPVSEVARAEPGSLEFFLTERYVLYSRRRDFLYRARVHHAPYPLQQASARIEAETLISSAGLRREDAPPLVHYAAKVDVEIFRLRRVD